MAYISTNDIRDKEVKVRFSSNESQEFDFGLSQKKAKYEKLTRASYMRIIGKVFHRLPPELANELFDEIVKENPNA